MNEDVARTWSAALRSGRYLQGVGALRVLEWDGYDELARRPPDRVRYCCLGVLCDLAREAGVGDWDGVVFEVDGEYEQSQLPAAVARWAGLVGPTPYDPDVYPCTCGAHDPDGRVDRNEDTDGECAGCRYGGFSMSDLNDSGDWDFQRIAGLVDERWREL